MQSTNKRAPSKSERAHIERIKALPCSVCDEPGPSEAHHIEQGQHWTVIAVCTGCHRGYNGWHGTKAFWRIRKMNELDAIAVTIRRAYGGERDVRCAL